MGIRPAAALVPWRMAAGHERSGPCTAQMPAAARLRQAKAAHVTRPMKAGMSARATAPTNNGTAPCHCLSSAFFARRAFTFVRQSDSLFSANVRGYKLYLCSNLSSDKAVLHNQKQTSAFSGSTSMHCSCRWRSPTCK